MTNSVPQSRRRPVWVWVIFIFYLLSAGYTFLWVVFVVTGAVTPNAAQVAYFTSLTSVDWVLTLSTGLLCIAGAVFLFLLQRSAVILFSISLVLNLASTAFRVSRANWMEGLAGPSLFSVLIPWLILVAVILYARHLTKTGVLQ